MLLQRRLDVITAKARRVDRQVDDAGGHQLPTSAWIAPGPSAVLP